MMFFRRCHFLWIFIISKSVSGDYVTKAVNSEATFSPGWVAPSTTSIVWKHKDNAGSVVKVIEWDREDDSTNIPNANFKSHATLDKSTGNLNLKYLQLKHSGVYTVDINSKEQRKQFALTVMESVSKPYITKDCSSGDVRECFLSCEGQGSSESTIIWKYCDGQKVQERYRDERKIKVTNSSNPAEHYSCTLKNAVSEVTSDAVYLRELFHDSNTTSVIAILSLVVSILVIAVVTVILFLKRHQISGYCAPRCGKRKTSKTQSERRFFF